jgi:hypothetical protein
LNEVALPSVRLTSLRLAIDLAKALSPQVLGQEELERLAERLNAAWFASWKKAFKRFPDKATRLQNLSKQLDDEQEDLIEWTRQSARQAEDDYTSAWLLAAIAAYLLAIGLDATEKERAILTELSQAKADAAKVARLEQAQVLVERIRATVQLADSIPTANQMVWDRVEQYANSYSPAVNARVGLTQFVEEAMGQAMANTDPLKQFLIEHKNMERAIRFEVGRFQRGEIDAAGWRARMVEIFEDYYREVYRLGKLRAGGDYRLTPADKEKLRVMLTDERKYLARWIKDAQSKYLGLPEDKREAKMQWRGGLYADALQGVFNAGWLSQIPSTEEVLWVTNPIAEHCTTCIEEAGMGWRRPEQLTRVPSDGTSICRTNCFTEPDVLVVMQNDAKLLGEINVGDYVLTHAGRYRKVTALTGDRENQSLRDEIILEARLPWPYARTQTFSVTPDHKFMLPTGEWVEARDIRIGDTLLSMTMRGIERTAVIEDKWETASLTKTWCLEVEEDHSFVIDGGIVSHNCQCYLERRTVPGEMSVPPVSARGLQYPKS